MGRVFAIGDVHGCLKSLQRLDTELVFSPDDTVITLGDYVDRGPDSKGVIDFLLDLRNRTKLVTLRGNHEIIMLTARIRGVDYLEAWLGVGGEETMASYSAKKWSDIPSAHWEFLESTLPAHESSTHFFVHANVTPDKPLDQQSESVLYWERFQGDERPHCSGKIMVCGHTSQHSGKPFNIGHAVCIDTWVYGDGWLTCLEVATGRYWQADEAGDFRERLLEKA